MGQAVCLPPVVREVAENIEGHGHRHFTLVRQCELKAGLEISKSSNQRFACDPISGPASATAHARQQHKRALGLLAPICRWWDGRACAPNSPTQCDARGLKAVADAGERLKMNSLKMARTFYDELHAALVAPFPRNGAHPDGFEYLRCWHTMTRRKDPDPGIDRRPQTAQWRCRMRSSPAVFDKNDQSSGAHRFAAVVYAGRCSRRDRGFWHESVWNYNASIAAHVYLWQTSRSGLIAPSEEF